MKRINFLFHLLLIACIYVTGITTATAQTLEALPINTFYSGSQVKNFFKRADGSYFFFGTDGTNGLQLWKTDGTPAGTVQLQAPAPYATGLPNTPSPTYNADKNWLLVNNELYFVVDSKYLFCSNGNSLQLLATAEASISELTASGNTVYFKTVDGVNVAIVVNLWKTNGTTAGTVALKTFTGGNYVSRASQQVSNITNVNGTVFFMAGADNDGIGYALYKSDGTTGGTVVVKDINTTDVELIMTDLYAAGRYLYFKANTIGTQTAVKEWWVSNGTAAGTYQITHFGNWNSSAIGSTITYNDTLYIAAPYGSPTYSREIWKLTPDPNNPDSILYEAQVNTMNLLQLVDGKIYFTDAGVASATKRLYTSSGSRKDTVLLKVGLQTRTPGTDGATVFYPLNGYNYFVASPTSSTYSLWRTDGTAAGTTMISNATKSPTQFIQVGNAFYFRAVDATSSATAYNIWKSDGTTAGTKKVTPRTFTSPTGVAAAATDGTYYYFTSTDSVWVTNGDTAINLPLGSASTLTGVRSTGIYTTPNKLMVSARLSVVSSNANLDLFSGDPGFNIFPQAQTITFANVTKTYGDADFALGATATSGLDITYSIADPAVATITNGTLHILKSGTTTITASQPGNGATWLPATDVTVTLTVSKAALTITADDKTKNVGDANPALTVSYSGFVNTETSAVLTTAPIVTTTATQNSQAGTYAITVGGATADNYIITYVNGTLTVYPLVQQPQTITFNDLIKTYGNADFDPGATASSGLAVTYVSDNSAVATIVNGLIHITGAGTANITASQNGNFAYSAATGVTKTLTVNKAALNIRAEDKSRFQDEPNPSLTTAYTGFAYGETFTSLSAQPLVTTTATIGTSPGVYVVTVSGATANNYVITYTEGTLTVKALPVTADKIEAVFNSSMLRVKVNSTKTRKAVLQLTDAAGRVLLTQEVSLLQGANTYQLPAFNIASGAYIVLVRGEGLKLSDKIIK